MLQNSLSCPHWIDIVEYKYPIQGIVATYSPILYASNLDQSKLFYERYFIDFPKFKPRSSDNQLYFLRMHYRGCNFTINNEGRFEFDAKFPTLTSVSSPFIFYIYSENRTEIFNEALNNGFKKLPGLELTKHLELMIFLVLCGR